MKGIWLLNKGAFLKALLSQRLRYQADNEGDTRAGAAVHGSMTLGVNCSCGPRRERDAATIVDHRISGHRNCPLSSQTSRGALP